MIFSVVLVHLVSVHVAQSVSNKFADVAQTQKAVARTGVNIILSVPSEPGNISKRSVIL